MRTRKKTLAAALGLAAAMTMAACGEGSGGSASSDGGDGGGGGGAGGEGVTVAFVPKLQGIPYFEAMNTGGKAAC